MKISCKRITLNSMVIENTLEKVPELVERVERSDSNLLRIQFKGLENPGYITEDGKFLHYCESTAIGGQCNHIALAGTIAHDAGLEVSIVGVLKTPEQLDSLRAKFDSVDYEDISDQFGVIPPSPAPSSTTSVTASAAAPSSESETPSVPKPSSAFRKWSDGWNEVTDHLKSEGISPRLIIAVREKRQSYSENVANSIMAMPPQKPAVPYMGSMLGRAIRHVLNGKALFLRGEKGSGKDTLAATLAWIFNLPLYIQTGNSDESKDSIVGEQEFKDNETRFKKSVFATCVENGGLMSYPEINMIHGDTTSIFHSVLDENRVLSTPEGAIPVHEGFVFIGSLNPSGGQYAGTKDLNGALKDRGAVLDMPYVDLRSILSRKSSLTDPHAIDFLVRVQGAIDLMVTTENQGEESKTIRGFIDAANYLAEFGVTTDTKVEAIEDYIVNKTDNREEKFAIRDMIRQKAWSDFPKTKEEEDYWNGEV